MYNSLEHGIFGWTKKDHKYISRKKGKNGKWQYIYKSVGSVFKKVAQAITSAVSKVFNKNSDIPVSTITPSETAKKEVESIVEKNKYSSIYDTKFKSEVVKKFKYFKKIMGANGKARYFYSEEEYNRYTQRQQILSKDYEFMQDVPVVDKKRTAAEAAKYVDVGTDSGNCSSCAIAFELQMRGYDVQSRADINGAGYSEWGINCFEGFDKNAGTKYNWFLDTSKEENKNYYKKSFFGLNKTSEEEQLQIAKNDLERTIKERGGDNQRGFISIHWTQTDPDENGFRHRSGGGHLFNYVVENGEVKYYDAQKGESNNQTGGEIDITTYLDNTDVITHRKGSDGGYVTYNSIHRVDDKELKLGAKEFISYESVESHDKPEEYETKIYYVDKSKEEKHG